MQEELGGGRTESGGRVLTGCLFVCHRARVVLCVCCAAFGMALAAIASPAADAATLLAGRSTSVHTWLPWSRTPRTHMALRCDCELVFVVPHRLVAIVPADVRCPLPQI